MKTANGAKDCPEKESAQIKKEEIIDRIDTVYKRCIQAEPVLIYDKELKSYVNSGEWKFDASNALKALKMLGDIVGLFDTDENADQGNMSYEEFLRTGSVSFDY